MAKVSILVPTWNNEQIFSENLRSVLSFTKHSFEYIGIYNGCNYNIDISGSDIGDIKILRLPENRGWMGGINAAKSVISGDYVLLLNDDTQVLDYDSNWLDRLVITLEQNKSIGAVGPISNAIMGTQNINQSSSIPHRSHTVPFLSGCCLLVRRELLDKVGWLDESLPGGDDMDLSIRIRDAGYELAVRRDVFILHRYATTGKRIYGEYWDSSEHTEAIRNALAKKHGFKKLMAYEHNWELEKTATNV